MGLDLILIEGLTNSWFLNSYNNKRACRFIIKLEILGFPRILFPWNSTSTTVQHQFFFN